ncbi:MAG TPA: ISKra4 family transposase, partial [Candidatus Acidoferrum sp.]|nr:ISKra4 family transposase [Candidatus Acidoferrum sp.]
DLEASEMAIRGSMHQLGGSLLEKVLNADGGGYVGQEVDCGQGHRARWVDFRTKAIVTVLGPVQVERAYYHCPDCGGGVIPKDRDWDVVSSGFSPGVRRLLGRVGSQESFEQGRQDLEALADIRVTAKQVERVAECIGQQVEALGEELSVPVRSGRVLVLKTIPTLYLAYDGTGVPMVARETEGRAGKQGPQARTREAKLGCVFTQTGLDEQGQPERDAGSTSYVGAIETAAAFGRRLYREAVRRGLDQAQRVVVLGDGAVWIWKIAEEHFPAAIQIVDLYHARQHLAELAQRVHGPASPKWKPWVTARYAELDASQVEKVRGAIWGLQSRDKGVQQCIERERKYFETNAERMRYAEFRRQGLFVGSGVVEAGCRSIIGHRLKQSGMHWTLRGANAIIALRCLNLSGLWEQFWETRASA